jgi:SAM-dependent methyltransferase
MSISKYSKETLKSMIRLFLPVSLRKRLAVRLSNFTGIHPARRSWWAQELVSDLRTKNINEYHRFLWSNHLAYAETYEVHSRFGYDNMEESRKLFFSDLIAILLESNLEPGRDVKSILEIGCSSGYQLRFMETDLFPSANKLHGIDIDEYALQSGTQYLQSIGSSIRLYHADMADLESFIDDTVYDLTICSGVLMYLNPDAASSVVHTALKHTRHILGLSGLAHPVFDNAQLARSAVRESDSSFIHNFDSMISLSEGKVLSRRWEGDRLIGGQTIYFVFGTGNSEIDSTVH